MRHEPTSTARAKRLRERRSRGVAMVVPVEVGEGGVALLVGNGLLEQHQVSDRNVVGAAYLADHAPRPRGLGARFGGWIGSMAGRVRGSKRAVADISTCIRPRLLPVSDLRRFEAQLAGA